MSEAWRDPKIHTEPLTAEELESFGSFELLWPHARGIADAMARKFGLSEQGMRALQCIFARWVRLEQRWRQQQAELALYRNVLPWALRKGSEAAATARADFGSIEAFDAVILWQEDAPAPRATPAMPDPAAPAATTLNRAKLKEPGVFREAVILDRKIK